MPAMSCGADTGTVDTTDTRSVHRWWTLCGPSVYGLGLTSRVRAREPAVRLHNLTGLKTLMVVRAVSQRRLARAAGYRSHAYLGRVLRGEVDTVEPGAARAIAGFLQVDVEFLFAPRLPSPAAHHARRRATVQGVTRRTPWSARRRRARPAAPGRWRRGGSPAPAVRTG